MHNSLAYKTWTTIRLVRSSWAQTERVHDDLHPHTNYTECCLDAMNLGPINIARNSLEMLRD